MAKRLKWQRSRTLGDVYTATADRSVYIKVEPAGPGWWLDLLSFGPVLTVPLAKRVAQAMVDAAEKAIKDG